jgi:peptide deformylase
MELVNENSEILRTKCIDYDFDIDGDPMPIIEKMTKVMFENNGIGLALPQVGINSRIFIMGNKDLLVACINPVIVNYRGLHKDQEGCLSFPNLWLNVNRASEIDVRFYQVDGTVKEVTLNGLMARVYQHELEHLDGICFDTKISRVSLNLAKKRRKKLK